MTLLPCGHDPARQFWGKCGVCGSLNRAGNSPTVSEPRTDSLIAAWRKWSDRFATGQGGETPIRDAFAAGWDARAEAAQPIDVERLARALTSRWRMVKAAGPRNGPTPLELARAIRSEYARLSEEEG